MEREDLISIQEFCTYYDAELTFIQSLNEFGLIEITTIEETHFIRKENIKDIEWIMRLHYDLEINLEGIDVIAHLLQKVDALQEELAVLRNKLELHKEE